mmetsp:Transcript_43581/g.139015  ORF Transcript_43581/g.139015 Transcript_43581/m.139015 type:complete len:118 (-) Transcript_43581:100-453(-)|eukprot:CAMPEP_0182864404 /NCGR_PEP_ID=MMETSP0034_2-20130328/7153_1 /TAXON_ID=156128 /ORGANISM="Nephroselmis pyriformis, Strain CCMP717" /LENGTH=117 /DNA_ID=CAMNT_0024996659 /DNA_START=113 /DNA_END=466 /DNA_ORIENTATION=+
MGYTFNPGKAVAKIGNMTWFQLGFIVTSFLAVLLLQHYANAKATSEKDRQNMSAFVVFMMIFTVQIGRRLVFTEATEEEAAEEAVQAAARGAAVEAKKVDSAEVKKGGGKKARSRRA